MIKIILTSNIHLNLQGSRVTTPEIVRINAFKKIVQLARNHDLLLIAGDLYNPLEIDNDAVTLISEEFEKLRKSNVEIVLTPGALEMKNGDNLSSHMNKLNINHIFSCSDYSTPYVFSRNGQKAYIYGMPACEDINVAGIKRISSDHFHIGLFYAYFNPMDEFKESNVHSIYKKDLHDLGHDFYAMGQSNQIKLFKFKGKLLGAYPGSPEYLNIDEKGVRYVLSLQVNNNEIQKVDRLRVNSARINEINIDCSHCKDCQEVEKKIKAGIVSSDIVVVNLLGRRNFIIDYSVLEDCAKQCLDIKIFDNSIPDINMLIRKYGENNTLRGEFFSLLKEKMEKNAIPPDVEIDDLAYIISCIDSRGLFFTEEWLCR